MAKMAAPDAEARRGRLRAIVFTIPAVIMLLGLGTWQVERLAWKQALIAERAAGVAMPPVPLTAPVPDAKSMAFRRVTVTGTFLHDKEIHLAARALRNGEIGFQIITPLLRENGPAVLVNRGWVPSARRDPATRAGGQTGGVVTVTGIVRLPGVQHLFTPDNDVAGNFWFWTDVEAMAGEAGVAVLPLLVEAGAAPNPGGFPLGGQTRLDLPNDHLEYAIIWYSFAVSLTVIFLIYMRGNRRRSGGDGDGAGDT